VHQLVKRTLIIIKMPGMYVGGKHFLNYTPIDSNCSWNFIVLGTSGIYLLPVSVVSWVGIGGVFSVCYLRISLASQLVLVFCIPLGT